jgi:hypothetical protein
MPGKPTLCPIVEIKIPQNPSYDGHIRRQTPEIGSRAAKRSSVERPTVLAPRRPRFLERVIYV